MILKVQLQQYFNQNQIWIFLLLMYDLRGIVESKTLYKQHRSGYTVSQAFIETYSFQAFVVRSDGEECIPLCSKSSICATVVFQNSNKTCFLLSMIPTYNEHFVVSSSENTVYSKQGILYTIVFI